MLRRARLFASMHQYPLSWSSGRLTDQPSEVGIERLSGNASTPPDLHRPEAIAAYTANSSTPAPRNRAAQVHLVDRQVNSPVPDLYFQCWRSAWAPCGSGTRRPRARVRRLQDSKRHSCIKTKGVPARPRVERQAQAPQTRGEPPQIGHPNVRCVASGPAG